MSAIIYIASDYPLKEVPNPHLKTLSVNEALAIGMENIPEQFLEHGFDRDMMCFYGRTLLIRKASLTMILQFGRLVVLRKIFIRRSHIGFTWSGTIRKAGRKK